MEILALGKIPKMAARKFCRAALLTSTLSLVGLPVLRAAQERRVAYLGWLPKADRVPAARGWQRGDKTMSRPVKTVDPKRVIYLASIGHTQEEIAALEDCSRFTIQRRFATQCEKGF